MFVFIGGTAPGKPQRWRSLKAEYCPHCHNSERWILEKRKQNITLFFIPVLSIKTEYLYYCPICGFTREIDKETFEHKVKFEAEEIS
jgi:rubredoxin